MKINDREGFIGLLHEAQSLGIIQELADNDMRDISFVNVTKSASVTINIEWFCNLGTIKTAGLNIWFNEVKISTSHPSFSAAIEFIYNGNKAAFIGKEYE